MKKLMLVGIFALIAVMVIGMLGTGAWFTDSGQTSTGTVTTGSLDLQVESYGTFTVANIEPGADYQSLGVFCTRNVGDYDMKWRGWIENVAGTPGFVDYLQVQAILNPVGYVGNYGPDGEVLFTGVPFTELMSVNHHIVMNDPVWPFAPGYVSCYDVQVRLRSDAPDTLQNASLTADLFLDATQRISTAW